MNNDIEKNCSCHLTGDDPNCVLHGEVIQFAGVPDLQALFGTRAMPNMPVAAPLSTPVGRVIDGGSVLLRPYEAKTAAPILVSCSCDQPATFGHDAGCTAYAIKTAPLQLLIAAAQLIHDQPTTEQWKTIKKAISDLVPSP